MPRERGGINREQRKELAQQGNPEALAWLATHPFRLGREQQGHFYSGLRHAKEHGVKGAYLDAYRAEVNKRADKEPTTPYGQAFHDGSDVRPPHTDPEEIKHRLGIFPSNEDDIRRVVRDLFIPPQKEE